MKGDSALNGRAWAAATWRSDTGRCDLQLGAPSAAPSNGRAKMGATILGAPLEAPGGGEGELKQSPSYRDTKAAPGVAYGAHKGAQGRTRAPKRHCTATQTRGKRAGTTNIPNRCQGMRMPR